MSERTLFHIFVNSETPPRSTRVTDEIELILK
jgi:hypothetical protein